MCDVNQSMQVYILYSMKSEKVWTTCWINGCLYKNCKGKQSLFVCEKRTEEEIPPVKSQHENWNYTILL